MKSVKLSIIRVPYLVKNTGPLTKQQKNDIMSQAGTEHHPFHLKEIPWTKEQLDKYFTGPYVISPHELEGGHRKKENYISTHFIIIDYDDGTPVKEVIDRLDRFPGSPLYYINHSSNSKPHLQKFHLVLPIDEPFKNREEHSLLVDALKQTFPGTDRTVITDCTRGMIRGNLAAGKTVMGGKNPLSTSGILNKAKKKRAEAVAAKVTTANKGRSLYLSPDQYVQLEDEHGEWRSLADLIKIADSKPHILCPVCGHNKTLRSADYSALTHNSTVSLNDDGLPIVYCSSCESRGHGSGGAGVYNFDADSSWEVVGPQIAEQYKDYFFLEARLCRVYMNAEVQPFNASIGYVNERAIDLQKDLKSRFLTDLAQKAVPASTFRFNQIGSIETDKPQYNWRGHEVYTKIPSIASDIADNAFIDEWLETLFQGHAGFIKQWLALYVYTNYKRLPVLILHGQKRGTGKTTFAEVVGNIFHPLYSRGKSDDTYTEYCTAKLFHIDEQNTDGKTLYNLLKLIGGNDELSVNIKYGPKYMVRNNLNVIITTNQLKPIHVESGELSLDPSNNQFFVREFITKLPVMDNRFRDKLLNRIGHYARTELKQVFDQMQASPTISQHRYGTPVPITDAQKRLFSLGVTTIEREADEVWQELVSETELYSKGGILGSVPLGYLDRFADEWYLKPAKLRDLVKNLELQNNYNSILTHLIKTRQLSDIVIRTNTQRLGYKLIGI